MYLEYLIFFIFVLHFCYTKWQQNGNTCYTLSLMIYQPSHILSDSKRQNFNKYFTVNQYFDTE
jgi:hypothetical protein